MTEIWLLAKQRKFRFVEKLLQHFLRIRSEMRIVLQLSDVNVLY